MCGCNANKSAPAPQTSAEVAEQLRLKAEQEAKVNAASVRAALSNSRG